MIVGVAVNFLKPMSFLTPTKRPGEKCGLGRRFTVTVGLFNGRHGCSVGLGFDELGEENNKENSEWLARQNTWM